jgi:hypothetical protein
MLRVGLFYIALGSSKEESCFEVGRLTPGRHHVRMPPSRPLGCPFKRAGKKRTLRWIVTRMLDAVNETGTSNFPD